MSTYNDYLMHHGVKGMKWGNRRGRPVSAKRAPRQNLKKSKSNSIGVEVIPIEVWALGKAFVDSMLGGGNDGL